MMTLLHFLLVAAAFSVAVARVSWKNSELLDQFDLQGKDTIHITVCSRGCYVFVSLPVHRSGCEDNIFVLSSSRPKESLSQIAARVNPSTGEMGYFELREDDDEKSIWNDNPYALSCPLAIFAVAKHMGNNKVPAPAPSLIDPRMHDHGQQWLLVTFFSYDPYTIDHLDINENTVVSLYHTGYDNIDTCNPIYSGSKWNRVIFPIRSPLLTILVNSMQSFTYSLKMGIEDRVVVDGEMETIVTSPGHSGCQKAGVFRYDIPQPSVDVHFVADFAMASSFASNMIVPEENVVKLRTDEGGVIPIWGDTRYGAPLSAYYHLGKQLNITWIATYEWSTFAFSFKISAASSTKSSSTITESATREVEISTLPTTKPTFPTKTARSADPTTKSSFSSAVAQSTTKEAEISATTTTSPFSSAIRHATTKGAEFSFAFTTTIVVTMAAFIATAF